jgi:transposase
LLKIRGVGQKYLNIIVQWQQSAFFSDEVGIVSPMIHEDALHILALNEKIKQLESHIEQLNIQSEIASLLRTMPGFGKTTTAEITGEIGTIERFAGESSLALYLGMATLDNSSGRHKGSKQPKHVNTRAKAAMMIAVDRHRKCVSESQRYNEKKRAEGKTHNQAIRALGRHLCRIIYKMLRNKTAYVLKSN